MKNVILKPGELICNGCNGKGFISEPPMYDYIRCQKCHGNGKIDWVENIMGKQPDIQKIIYASTPSIGSKYYDTLRQQMKIFDGTEWAIFKEDGRWTD